MKLLHQLGHKKNWNVEAYSQNNIGDGFIFCAYNNEMDKIGGNLYHLEPKDYLPISLLDLQFYGGKKSVGGKLDTYPFHPINHSDEETSASLISGIKEAIEFQKKSGFKKIIIPHIYNIKTEKDYTIKIINSVNEYISSLDKGGCEYYMTIPFSIDEIRSKDRVEEILQAATDMKIVLDGYYVVCEQNLTGNKKISEDYLYYENLSRVFITLKNQGFKIIHGFSNVDSVVFSAITDIDFVSIGTYEVQRTFNIERYIEDNGGGGSKGWYFSEKLLNFVRSQELEMVRVNGGISLISNEDNVFSDTILKEDYDWNIHKPEVHKNYLLAISKILKEISSKPTKEERINFVLEKALNARNIYRELEEKAIFFSEESSGYHLPKWQSILTQNLSR